MRAALLAVGLLAQTVAPGPAVWRLALADGSVYRLQAPPRPAGERLEFTTEKGFVYSVSLQEVVSSLPMPTPRPTPVVFDPHDDHNLGAIARQQRAGAPSAVAPAPTRRGALARPTARPTPTPTPRPLFGTSGTPTPPR
ncbi:MAG TPA: hypothetical protein VIA29_07425 [Thermoanaerobaculia bacterium]|jgi:hypothetical protein